MVQHWSLLWTGSILSSGSRQINLEEGDHIDGLQFPLQQQLHHRTHWTNTMLCWLRNILTNSHRMISSCPPYDQEPLHNEMLSGGHLDNKRIFCAHYEKSILTHFPLSSIFISCFLKVPDQLVKFLATSYIDVGTNLKLSSAGLSKQCNVLSKALLIEIIPFHKGLSEPS